MLSKPLSFLLLLFSIPSSAPGQPKVGFTDVGACSIDNGVLQMTVRALTAAPTPAELWTGVRPALGWNGSLSIEWTNVSTLPVRFVEFAPESEYEIALTGRNGKPAALTVLGKDHLPGHARSDTYAGSVGVVDLEPYERQIRPTLLGVARFFEVNPDEAYKITITRTEGLLTKDQIGREVKNPRLSCSFDIPAGPLPQQ